jgi:DNA-3-methyladenine glycosylase I
MPGDARPRCSWVPQDPLYLAYHDDEWGVPVRDERRLYEKLVLEGAQSGLSWRTVLIKRPAYRAAFADFDPEAVARFPAARIDELMADAGLIRNRAKLESALANARAVLELREEGGLGALLWSFVDGEPVQNRWTSLDQLPARTEASSAMSRELKRRGFSFVGPTTCYALMQSCGLVNDHLVSCFRHAEVEALAR